MLSHLGMAWQLLTEHLNDQKRGKSNGLS
jgi:hypothetical protein